MKTLFRITIAALIVATAAGCDAFKTLNNSKKSAQGKPYDLIVRSEIRCARSSPPRCPI